MPSASAAFGNGPYTPEILKPRYQLAAQKNYEYRSPGRPFKSFQMCEILKKLAQFTDNGRKSELSQFTLGVITFIISPSDLSRTSLVTTQNELTFLTTEESLLLDHPMYTPSSYMTAQNLTCQGILCVEVERKRWLLKIPGDIEGKLENLVLLIMKRNWW